MPQQLCTLAASQQVGLMTGQVIATTLVETKTLLLPLYLPLDQDAFLSRSELHCCGTS